MSFDVNSIVRTENQGRQLLDYIDTINGSLYRVNEESFDQVVNAYSGDEMQVLLNAEIKNMSKEQIEDYLHKLSDLVKSMKIIRLDIAVRLPDEALERIHKWLRENVTAGLLIRITVDPTLVAGAIITYEGRYCDKTLRKKMERVLNENKAAYVK